MRAIFINAVDRKVEEVQIENKLQAFYDKIGCEMIQILHLGGNTIAIATKRGSYATGRSHSDSRNPRASPETP